MRGEVSTASVTLRRRAGTSAYSLAEEAASTTGADRTARLFRLCAWNAFAFQTIADTMLDVDTSDDPRTAGYVARSTLHFVDTCLDQVPVWIRAARIVQSDPSSQLKLPAALPRWTYDEPTTAIELHGLRSAYEALYPRVATDLQTLEAAAVPELDHIRREFAEMTSSVDYAQGLDLRGIGPVERGEVRARLLDGMQRVFLLGQLLAVPSLVEMPDIRRPALDAPLVAADRTWMQVDPGWPVLDADGQMVGLVERMRGDRTTCELTAIDVDRGSAHATLSVPASALARIERGEIRLSVKRSEL